MDKQYFNETIKKAEAKVEKILQERGAEYGDFKKLSAFCYEFNLRNLRQLSEKILSLSDDEYISAAVAIFMIGLKLARLENGAESLHFDSVIDFLGYLQLLKNVEIQGLELVGNIGASALHEELIQYANEKLKEDKQCN